MKELKNPRQYCIGDGHHAFEKPVTDKSECAWCENTHKQLEEHYKEKNKDMKKYVVSFDALHSLEVMAKSEDDAQDKAIELHNKDSVVETNNFDVDKVSGWQLGD